MSTYRQQYADRVRQALATDARTAGTTIDGLSIGKCYDVAYEIADLYPDVDAAEILEATLATRAAAKEEATQ